MEKKPKKNKPKRLSRKAMKELGLDSPMHNYASTMVNTAKGHFDGELEGSHG